MSFIKVYIHFIWSTKNRFSYLNTRELRMKVWDHIRQNAKEKGIFVDFVSGYSDHCHCLISLGTDQTIQRIMQLVKGESSFWINKNQLTAEKFEWQDEYYGVSVSESILPKVRKYIENQEQHHRKKSFQEEYEDFILKHGFQKFND
ncbi:transposase [Algoriphagus winogradskyi]|uniref:REP element-mobilizing transposase RayT n=1 Tax=Algoriphagus winogradskyi TaxID=237017 RepID=A0ABY1N6A9_9BACT|nr:transposase [Algoriphagus winogradskyi]SMP01299.1 REP element-mobilizing transposase RayT [Algoriphagus winogradskyi]